MIYYKITFNEPPFPNRQYGVSQCHCYDRWANRTFVAKKDSEQNNYYRFWDKNNDHNLYYAHPDWLKNIEELP